MSEIEIMEEKQGWTGSALKLIAIITMLIDHAGATIVERMITHNPANYTMLGELKLTPVTILYFVMRGIGRIAFPIFAFFIIEGFVHTRSKAKYVGRMCLFALVSEVPFDVAFQLSFKEIKDGRLIELGYQNVFFTLAIGLVTIWVVDLVQQLSIEQILKWILQFGTMALGMALAYALRTDYDLIGVLTIIVGYMLRKKKKHIRMLCMIIPLAIMNLLEALAFIDVWFISKYNGARGKNMKWFFYLFYPVHLMILAGVCMLLGI